MAFDGEHKEDAPRLNALMRLADILEQKELSEYDHGYFVLKQPQCGTSACALGWAVVEMGEELGLTMEVDKHYGGVHFFPRHTNQKEDYACPYEAGAMAFNISYHEAEALFGYDYGSPSTGPEAAKMLRKFVAMKVKEMA